MNRLAKEYKGIQRRLAESEWLEAMWPVMEEEEEEEGAETETGDSEGGNLSEWVARFWGPEGTPFEGFLLEVTLSVDVRRYPLTAPRVAFRRRTVAHPNVQYESGEICLDVLKEAWTPVYGLVDLVGAVRRLLGEPGLESPLDVDMARVYAEDYAAYEQVVRYRLMEASAGVRRADS